MRVDPPRCLSATTTRRLPLRFRSRRRSRGLCECDAKRRKLVRMVEKRKGMCVWAAGARSHATRCRWEALPVEPPRAPYPDAFTNSADRAEQVDEGEHQHEGGLVLDVEAREVEPPRAPSMRSRQADAPSRSTKESLREARIVPDVTLNTGSAFEAAPRRQVIDVKAAAYRADRRPIGFRPAQPAEPPIRRILTFGEDRLERQRSRGLFSDIALEGSATSEMTGWAERRPGVARL